MTPGDRRRPLALAAAGVALVAAVWLVFGQTRQHGFVNYDDDAYLFRNPVVARGLTRDGVAWAFAATHADNWHPLTWLSHMLDVQLFGLAPGGHHVTSVLLHALASVLLLLALHAMTGALWPSAFVAAAFAVHPLRAESVAWVSERKDVLSAVFFMLVLLAYAGYTRRPSIARYLPVAALLALGLLCKPMLVTVPVVLLLLDVWPLGRLRPLRRTLPEKLPLLALAAASVVLTLRGPGGGAPAVRAVLARGPARQRGGGMRGVSQRAGLAERPGGVLSRTASSRRRRSCWRSRSWRRSRWPSCSSGERGRTCWSAGSGTSSCWRR